MPDDCLLMFLSNLCHRGKCWKGQRKRKVFALILVYSVILFVKMGNRPLGAPKTW